MASGINPALALPLLQLKSFARGSAENQQHLHSALQIFQRQLNLELQGNQEQRQECDFLEHLIKLFPPEESQEAYPLLKQILKVFQQEFSDLYKATGNRALALGESTLLTAIDALKRANIQTLQEQIDAFMVCLPRVQSALSQRGFTFATEGLTPEEIIAEFQDNTSVQEIVSQIHELDLSGLKLKHVPYTILIESFKCLKKLELSKNCLSTLPPLWELPELTWLDLDHNQFVQAPALRDYDSTRDRFPLHISLNHNELLAEPPKLIDHFGISYSHEGNPLKYRHNQRIPLITKERVAHVPDVISFFRNQIHQTPNYGVFPFPESSLFYLYFGLLFNDFEMRPFYFTRSKLQRVTEILKQLPEEDQKLIEEERAKLTESLEWNPSVLYGALHNAILSKYSLFSQSPEWSEYRDEEWKQDKSVQSSLALDAPDSLLDLAPKPEHNMIRLAYLVECFGQKQKPTYQDPLDSQTQLTNAVANFCKGIAFASSLSGH